MERRDRNVRLHRDGTPKPRANCRVGLAREEPVSGPIARGRLQQIPKTVEPAESQITLEQLPIGSRLLVRSKMDWRFAAISRKVEDMVVLTVCSPRGRTYRLRREMNSEIFVEGKIPILVYDEPDDWRENFGRYDLRW